MFNDRAPFPLESAAQYGFLASEPRERKPMMEQQGQSAQQNKDESPSVRTLQPRSCRRRLDGHRSDDRRRYLRPEGSGCGACEFMVPHRLPGAGGRPNGQVRMVTKKSPAQGGT